jgi:hypothetical protein
VTISPSRSSSACVTVPVVGRIPLPFTLVEAERLRQPVDRCAASSYAIIGTIRCVI